jgi:hypothetical protein
LGATAYGALLVFVLAGQAFAAGMIQGKVATPSADYPTEGGFVVAANEANTALYRVAIDADGAYLIEGVEPGKYTISAIRGGLTAPDAKGVEVKDGATVTQDFAMVTRPPFTVLKSATPIPLNKHIDSDAFADADEIQIGAGKDVGVGPVEEWFKDGGPKLVSGRFRVKYSTQAIHLAAAVTFEKPLVNPHADGNLWTGNALEFDIQNDPYDPTRTDKNKDHNWQVVVGLGAVADWWEHNVYNMRPRIAGKEVKIDSYIERIPNDKGEQFRLDIPWAILLTQDENGKPIDPPADDSLGAMDIVLDVANPTDPDTRKYQIQWSGLGNSHWNASSLVPVRFATKKP